MHVRLASTWTVGRILFIFSRPVNLLLDCRTVWDTEIVVMNHKRKRNYSVAVACLSAGIWTGYTIVQTIAQQIPSVEIGVSDCDGKIPRVDGLFVAAEEPFADDRVSSAVPRAIHSLVVARLLRDERIEEKLCDRQNVKKPHCILGSIGPAAFRTFQKRQR
jgi:hypothetical protein